MREGVAATERAVPLYAQACYGGLAGAFAFIGVLLTLDLYGIEPLYSQGHITKGFGMATMVLATLMMYAATGYCATIALVGGDHGR